MKKIVFRLLRRLVFLIFVAALGMVILLRWVPVGITPLMAERALEALFDRRPISFQKQWVSLDAIHPNMMCSVLAAEDTKFFDHSGFDWDAIEKAWRHNHHSRRVHGGSTISQQVAKNVFLWPGRSWLRKSLEAVFTVLIETVWSKRRILEVYLNVVELGDGVFGVEAASRAYFHTSAAHLSSSQAALLAAILPNPRKFSARAPNAATRFRQSMIERRLRSAAELFPWQVHCG